MKKLFLFFIAFVFGGSLFAQTPQKMSYQAVIRNSSNTLVTSTTVGMRVSILQGSASGTAVYVETQTPTTNLNGLISIEIGAGTLVSGSFSAIDWSNNIYFIKTETAPTVGTNYTITGTSQLISVPYALHAKTAESLTGSSGLTHYIGELYQGGIIVSVWKSAGVEHGLIASLTDLSASQAWSNVTTTLIGPTAQNHLDGQINTNAIISQAGHTNSAAKLCSDYTSGGYSDWYLPSLWELNQCFDEILIVNTVLGDINGFSQSLYWASTELYNNNAWLIGFETGNYANYSKNNAYSVRAVRRF